MSIEREIAAGVVSLIAGGTYTQQFTPKRTVLPSLELETLGDDVQVLVIATEDASAAEARGRDRHLITVQTAVVKRVVGKSIEEITAEVDALCDLVEAINDECRAPISSPSAGWQGRSRAPIYDQNKLDTEHVFISVTENRYLHIRTLT